MLRFTGTSGSLLFGGALGSFGEGTVMGIVGPTFSTVAPTAVKGDCVTVVPDKILPSADLFERREARHESSFGLSFTSLEIRVSSASMAVEILARLELRGGGFNSRGNDAVALGAVEALLCSRERLIGDVVDAVLYLVPAECLVLVSCRAILSMGGSAT